MLTVIFSLRLQKFKVRIEDPPRRRHMVFLGGAVLANLVCQSHDLSFNHHIANLAISLTAARRQRQHVGFETRMGGAGSSGFGEAGPQIRSRCHALHHKNWDEALNSPNHPVSSSFSLVHPLPFFLFHIPHTPLSVLSHHGYFKRSIFLPTSLSPDLRLVHSILYKSNHFLPKQWVQCDCQLVKFRSICADLCLQEHEAKI